MSARRRRRRDGRPLTRNADRPRPRGTGARSRAQRHCRRAGVGVSLRRGSRRQPPGRAAARRRAHKNIARCTTGARIQGMAATAQTHALAGSASRAAPATKNESVTATSTSPNARKRRPRGLVTQNTANAPTVIATTAWWTQPPGTALTTAAAKRNAAINRGVVTARMSPRMRPDGGVVISVTPASARPVIAPTLRPRGRLSKGHSCEAHKPDERGAHR